jgi:hypothetical protein
MLIQMRAVEVRQPILVVGEVRRHPVEDDSNVVLMQVVDQVHEVLRRAKARAGSVITRYLVSQEPKKGCSMTGRNST